MKIHKRAEEQIKRAQLKGELDNLKGAGKPLPARGDGDLAEAAGFRIMAEAGAVPEEIRLRNEVEAQLKRLQSITDPDQRKTEMSILADLQMRLGIQEEARRKFDKNR